jgi:predicted ATPase with chaperone activity
MTERGGRRAARLMEISGYVGPAPVPLEAYSDSLGWQFEHFPICSPGQVAAALQEMVLPPDVVHVAGLALLSRRSLFLHGPPGNGKTCLGHLLHSACEGELWIPHCLGIDENIIRVFDAQCHEPVAGLESDAGSADIDRRWVRIRRPFVVVGGELSLDSLDLTYSQSLGYYEAPLHFKANGGTFLLDDFGCQLADPAKFLNRWIHPLERGVDFLTLQTGQQLRVPFCQMLIVSTNVNPNDIMSPAFLRRLGYRLHLDNPTPQRYAEIFERYAAVYDLAAPRPLVEGVIKRYLAEGRPMRCCEPRDLIERARDISRYSGTSLELTPEILDTAWRGYFGNHG